MSIPIIINNFNRLSTTKKLVEDLNKLDYKDIYILDICSTYKPLLDWYESRTDLSIIKLTENLGQQAFWKANINKLFKNYPFVVYTDSDIELNQDTPKHFIESLVGLAETFNINKVGLAIKIDDLPDNYLGQLIRKIEITYWTKRLQNKPYEVYAAPIDTTFCIVKPQMLFTYHAIRVAGNFTCKHKPWYTDWSKLDDEEEYFMKVADEKISTYKQHYLDWKIQNNK